jgi:hypothetical protein
MHFFDLTLTEFILSTLVENFPSRKELFCDSILIYCTVESTKITRFYFYGKLSVRPRFHTLSAVGLDCSTPDIFCLFALNFRPDKTNENPNSSLLMWILMKKKNELPPLF